jgi:hypothetical protein
MKRVSPSLRADVRMAKSKWPSISRAHREELLELIGRYCLSVTLGDVMLLDHHWYVTHSGLLRLAHRKHCLAIETMLEKELCDPSSNRWVFRAVVQKSARSKGFVGYGDADPSNVSSLVAGAEMRVAETRAVNRALRKAYGIGLCSVEELGALSGSSGPANQDVHRVKPATPNGSSNGQPRLRDKLCLLIRQYNLDPNLVKAYAADFCGTEKLGGASRDMVESFINQLSKSAKENRDSLICKLNSYAQPQEVSS